MANKWNKHVMATYRSMKSRSPNTKLGDAMKAAKKTWKKSGGGNNPAPATRKNRRTRKNRSTRKN